MRLHLYGRNRVGLVSFLLFCFSLSLSAYSHKNPAIGAFGQGILLESARPFTSMIHMLYSGGGGIVDRYLYLLNTEAENKELRDRLDTLERSHAAGDEAIKENDRLRNLLDIADTIPHRYKSATVIAYDPSSWVQAVTINRGGNDGIEVGFPVIAGAGIVGQVISVSQHAARVLLIIDRSSGVDVLTQDGRARGILDGTGGRDCDLKFVSEAETVNIGDKLVTSGLDGVFPKGLPVGAILAVDNSQGGLFKSIRVRPLVKFSKLEEVIVVLKNKET